MADEYDDFNLVPDKGREDGVGNDERFEADIDDKELDKILDSVSSDVAEDERGADLFLSESGDALLEDNFFNSVPVLDDSNKSFAGIPETEPLLEIDNDEPLKLSPADEVRDENSPDFANNMLDLLEAEPEDLKMADLNFSGVLSNDEIEETGKNIELKREDIEALLRDEEPLQEPEDDDPDKSVDLEEDIIGIKNPDRVDLSKFLTEETLGRVIKEGIKESIAEATDSFFEEKLIEALEKTMPRIVQVAEKAIWDVIPDVARVLIKKEINKIREEKEG